jgi:hypothetical protein
LSIIILTWDIYSVITTLDIIEELTTPDSNLAGRLLIECSKGELDVVKDLTSEAEEVGLKLPLQPMLITSLAFKHIEVAKFCIEKGALIDSEVEVAVWLAMSLEIFELTFPHDIFRWSRHREVLDGLLFDCFDRWPPRPNLNKGMTQSESPEPSRVLI